MFRRRSAAQTPTDTSDETPEQALRRLEAEGKGRPTPSRRAAEADRRARLKPVRDRKELARRERSRKSAERQKMRAALVSGDDKSLPPRDKGPVRRFARDFVDCRRNIAQYLLPLLLLILLLSFFPRLFAGQLLVWSLTIALTSVDSIWLVVRLRRELRRRFEPAQTKGAVSYAVLRSTQLRRLRLPKPRIGYGEPLPERY